MNPPTHTIEVKGFYVDYDKMTDNYLFGKAFEMGGDNHAIMEVIRRYIVLTKEFARREREMIKAQQQYEAEYERLKTANPKRTIKLLAVDLRDQINQAIQEIEDESFMSTDICVATKGGINVEFYIMNDEDGIAILEIDVVDFHNMYEPQ